MHKVIFFFTKPLLFATGLAAEKLVAESGHVVKKAVFFVINLVS